MNGVYRLAMGVALWRRQQWARVWLVLTTALAGLVLMMLVRRGTWDTYWFSALSAALRIMVGAMMFLPSVRRWFTPRHVSG